MSKNKNTAAALEVATTISAVRPDSEAVERKRLNGSFPIMWVDMKRDRDQQGEEDLIKSIPRASYIYRTWDAAELSKAIQDLSPSLLCFDFDIPDKSGLSLLQETKKRHPALPVVVLTDYHSEELALWAFHIGARDFIVKPVAPDEFAANIMTLLDLHTQGRGYPNSRRCVYPQLPLPLPSIATSQTEERKKTDMALVYIAAHFNTRISLGTLARQCYLSPAQFCRTFKKEQGLTFSEYLARYRMAKARELLARPHASIKQVAFAVGYYDLSHFTRMFRRYVAMAPSEYKKKRKIFS